MRERMDMLVLDWRRRLYFYKKSYAIFIPRAAAPVATTTLGPGTCPRPKEVVDWYTNGENGIPLVLTTVRTVAVPRFLLAKFKTPIKTSRPIKY